MSAISHDTLISYVRHSYLVMNPEVTPGNMQFHGGNAFIVSELIRNLRLQCNFLSGTLILHGCSRLELHKRP